MFVCKGCHKGSNIAAQMHRASDGRCEVCLVDSACMDCHCVVSYRDSAGGVLSVDYGELGSRTQARRVDFSPAYGRQSHIDLLLTGGGSDGGLFALHPYSVEGIEFIDTHVITGESQPHYPQVIVKPQHVILLIKLARQMSLALERPDGSIAAPDPEVGRGQCPVCLKFVDCRAGLAHLSETTSVNSLHAKAVRDWFKATTEEARRQVSVYTQRGGATS